MSSSPDRCPAYKPGLWHACIRHDSTARGHWTRHRYRHAVPAAMTGTVQDSLPRLGPCSSPPFPAGTWRLHGRWPPRRDLASRAGDSSPARLGARVQSPACPCGRPHARGWLLPAAGVRSQVFPEATRLPSRPWLASSHALAIASCVYRWLHSGGRCLRSGPPRRISRDRDHAAAGCPPLGDCSAPHGQPA